MSKSSYVLLFVLSCVCGFALTHATYKPEPESVAPPVSVERLAKAYRTMAPFTLELLETYFTTQTGRALVYVYRSDCAACNAQWRELEKMTTTMPLLALSADDTPHDFAAGLAASNHQVPYVPYYVPPSRQLAMRTWLRDHNCRFTGALPFVALTDGKGGCIMAWQGLTASSAIEGVANYVASAPTAR